MLYCYVSMSSFVLQHQFGLSAQQYSFAFGSMAVGMAVTAAVGTRLVPRHGPGPVVVLGLAVGTAGGAALLAASLAGAPVGVFLLCLLPTVAVVSFVVPGATALALSGRMTQVGAASGVLGVLQFGLGGLVAPLLSTIGTTAPVMAAGMVACAAVGLLVAWRGVRSRPPARGQAARRRRSRSGAPRT